MHLCGGREPRESKVVDSKIWRNGKAKRGKADFALKDPGA